MIFTRLFFSLSLIFLFQLLPAQSNWQISGGLEVQKGRNTYTNKAQPITAYNSVVNLERIIDFPKSRATIVLHLGWQYLSGSGSDILYAEIPGVMEELKAENLLIGPGLQLSLWKRRDYHPIIGLQIYFGMPMGAEYKAENQSMDGTIGLPSVFTATGGTMKQVGMNMFAGLERRIGERSSLRLKLGAGQHSQFRSWKAKEVYHRVLLKGGLWMASMEVAYQL